LVRVLLLGLFEPALAYLGETAGLDRTSATNGALIMGLECVFVVVLAAVLLHEPTSAAVAVAIGLAVVGLVVLESGDSVVGPGLGDTLVLLGSLCAAVYTIIARGLDVGDDPMCVTAIQFTAATAVAFPVAGVAWATGAETVPTHVDARFVAAAALVGIVGFAGSFVLYNYAIATVEAAPAAVIVNLIPAVGLLSAVVLLGERPTSYALTGAVLICLSVVLFGALEALATRGATQEPVLDLRVLVDDVELRELARTPIAS
jgi:drug/metabolite transporter (DMT)-like permease